MEGDLNFEVKSKQVTVNKLLFVLKELMFG